MTTAQRSGIGLLAVALGTLTAPLDSAVNIAFPAITSAFGLAVEDIRWVVICYVLTYSSLMLIFGRLGDVIGYRRIFVAGLVVGAAGFAACTLAPSYPALLAARVLQGVGVALILACGPALATSLYDEALRTRVLGIYAAIMATGSALGPLLFGFLVERYGWSIVFLARIPLCLGGLALAWALPAAAPGSMRGFDLGGALLMIAWSVGLLMAVAAHSTPYGLALQLALGAAGAVAFVAFVARARRHPAPIIRPALFADPRFLAMNLTSIAVNFAAFSILLLVPFFLVRAMRLGSGDAGLVLALSAVGAIVGSTIAGRLAPRIGAGRLASLGIGLSASGLYAISLLSGSTSVATIAAALAVHGLGLGLFQVAYTDLVVATLPKAERGVAGSLTMVTRTIGVVGAATGLAAAHRMFEADAVARGLDRDDAFVAGFSATFAVVAIGLAIVFVVWLAFEALDARRRHSVPSRSPE